VKLDFEKTSHNINWSYLFTTLQQRSFSEQWINWIKCTIWEGRVKVMTNGVTSQYFEWSSTDDLSFIFYTDGTRFHFSTK
jgi:hypothetical protein